MTNDNVPPSPSGDNRRISVSHFGKVEEVGIECAVLDDGRQFYVRRTLHSALGFANQSGSRFRRFLEEISPKALELIDKADLRFTMVLPGGGTALPYPAGILTEIVGGVIDAALDGRLGQKRMHILQECRKLSRALSRTGEAGLIDDVTGYRHLRSAGTLHDLFVALLRDEPADWKRRFHAGYYQAICSLFGFKYDRHRPLPSVVGRITERWVYGVLFPREVIDEMRARRDDRSLHDKLHQWLVEGPGIKALDAQIKEITTIAGTSTDYRDFEARCTRRWPQEGQQLSMIYPFKPAA
ncbi:P63C domain-containing protein [Azospirillum argentinense]